MAWSYARRRQRVLIVSSHPLFGQGLRSLLQERVAPTAEVVGLAAAQRHELLVGQVREFLPPVGENPRVYGGLRK